MTHGEKQILLVDLSGRLLYGVVVHTDHGDIKLDRKHCGIGVLYYEDYSEEAKKECGYDETDFSIIISGCFYGNNIKPYLRSLSSMTEEEKEEYHELCDSYYGIYFDSINSIDWLNKRHFDYRGLLEMGLALEAPEGMYNIKEHNKI